MAPDRDASPAAVAHERGAAAVAPLLVCRGASFGHAAAVISGVDLTLGPGERLVVLGPNGAGKSTLLRGLIGLLPPRVGSVTLGGSDVGALGRHDIARRIAYLPQEVRPAAGLSALEVVLLGRAVHRARGPAAWAFDTPDDAAAAEAALADVGVLALAARPFQSLSGGERRLVLVAQALVQARDAVLLDEPTAALDLRAQWRVVERLRDAAGRRGLAVVVVTHDLTMAGALADRLVLLGEGGILADGAPAEVLVPERLERAFGLPVSVTQIAGRTVVVPRAPA